MYDNLAADKKKVEIFIEKQKPKAIKAFKHEKKFPNCKCYEYIIPATRNQYIIFFYAESFIAADSPTIGSYFYIFDKSQRFVVKWGASPYKHTEGGEITLLRQLHVYTYHFFQRYNERFLKRDNVSANELASIFLARNLIATPIDVTDTINRNADKYNDNNHSVKIRDGFCFARLNFEGKFDENGKRENDEVYAACFVYTTFLSPSDLSDIQKSTIDKRNIEAWSRLRDDFSNGTISLKLNH